MSVNIKDCRPVNVVLSQDSVTLEEMKGFLPDAIDILAKYRRYSEAFGDQYVYRVLMPYKFNAPLYDNPFGDTTETTVRFYGEYDTTVDQGVPVLAQDVEFIQTYYH